MRMTMSSLKTYQNVASAASSRPFRHVGDDFPAYVANDILCAIARISREQIEHPGAEIRIDRLLPRGNIRAAIGRRAGHDASAAHVHGHATGERVGI